MKHIQKINIAILFIFTLLPLFSFAQIEFPTGSGYEESKFNKSAIQDPKKKNTDTFPTGSGYNQFNGSALQPPATAKGLGQKTLQQLVTDFVKVATKYVLQILLALTIMMFLYGLMKFMFKGQGSDTARTEGRNLMLWGIIGIFVITAIWSLVAIFAAFVGHDSIVIPQFK